jgi:peptidoglycan hydrolase CwlO-like protein
VTVLIGIGAALGILISLGVVVNFLRSSADKGTIESQERSITALTTELMLCNSKCDKLETRVRAVENENEVLRAQVSHIEEIRQLQADMTEVLALVRGLA